MSLIYIYFSQSKCFTCILLKRHIAVNLKFVFDVVKHTFCLAISPLITDNFTLPSWTSSACCLYDLGLGTGGEGKAI